MHQIGSHGEAPLKVPEAASLVDVPELCDLSAEQLVNAYRDAILSPVAVTLAALDRAAAVNTALNAFTLIDHDGALSAAKASEARWRAGNPAGPLDGVPTTIKDIVTTEGWPSRLGSRTTDASPQPLDAPSVQLLRRAGAVLIGQTTTPEFGWKAVTDGPLFGKTRNPWNPDLTPGGSSGGAAVAAATGAGVLHLGSDGGGSIRIPASFTGIVGHKPTFGRVPAFPPSAFGTVSHIGPMARRVEDAIAMLDILSGRDLRDWHQSPVAFKPARMEAQPSLNGRRIGLWTTPPAGRVSPQVAAQVQKAAATIELLGARVEAVELPLGGLLDLFHTLWFAGAATRLRTLTATQRSGMDPGLLEIAEIGSHISAADYVAASVRRAEFGAAMERLFESFDLLISPATAITAFAIGMEVPPGSNLKRWTEWAGFSFPLNLSQQPACSIPCGFSADNLPIGLQIIGPRGADQRVLAAAAVCERAFKGQLHI
ncbi:amidase [Phyllobacterium leguminum]|uniref:Amidase/aspartyl-tRNA(Asn)/glutamyl-tRNA(Gln) amidotransferase subunit A n=1 Tax=Phyllobacterium leguminum TaxID=314237 RepID=A0A318T2U1_9HYPH|nr:amidase [Phyllobacterium leguminum]PYE86969.1 amidase/aspartyl-tRNA(Asn)/glutamyl-tRNA(Gln) amidotransferase subunit A [Phyllobacterium leguminum]